MNQLNEILLQFSHRIVNDSFYYQLSEQFNTKIYYTLGGDRKYLETGGTWLKNGWKTLH